MINSKSLFNSFILFTVIIFISSSVFTQQLQTPRASPASEVSQKIGMSKITVNYSRPAVQGREIWGELVPYGFTTFGFGAGNPAPWRAGANENTTITFTDDVKIDGQSLYAGTYGLSIAVQKDDDWIIIFSKDNGSWGSFFYDEANDALRVTAKPEESEFTEWLEYGFDNNTVNSTRVFLKWENIKVGFSIEFYAYEITLTSIRTQLKSLPGFQWQGWNGAAFYCLQNKINLAEAEQWCQKSIGMNENANNRNLLGYLVMGQDRMDEALQIFEENMEKYPENWNVIDSYGEALNTAGKTSESIEYYIKAHEMAPDNQKQRIEGILAKLEE